MREVEQVFMDVIRGSENIPAGLKGAVVTIGNFDGVHLGHQYIFRRLIAVARKEQRPAVVISFDPHPKMILHPERRPFYLITSLEEKIRNISNLGIDALILIPFSLDYARTTAEEFVSGFLWEKLRIYKILIGQDYTFGRGKGGNEAFLTAAGNRLGFDVEVLSAFKVRETTISSTRIRNALLAGDVRHAASLLGRPYNLAGEVISGSHRGVDLGFPTANIRPDKELVPPNGVYAVHVILEGNRHRGALNIGFNPTFADRKLSIEVHIFDFNENIYGKRLDLLLIERLREEIRFASPGELIAQIDRDISRVREILQAEPP
jgi:riboflavin kinase/FMN adenylyltransferase